MPQNPQTDSASLQRMHDIVAPEPVSWWPLAPGWNALLVFLTACLIVALVVCAQKWYRDRYRRLASKQLESLRMRIAESANQAELLVELSQLVKRTLLAAWPRVQVASLSGEPLLQFLDRSGNTNAFTAGVGRVLGTAAYRPNVDSNLTESQTEELFTVVRHWIKNHSVERSFTDQGGEV